MTFARADRRAGWASWVGPWVVGLALLFGVLFYFNAYVCDDAFISFRSVDNFVRGHGLRWNVEERVQSFTSPAFTLLMSAFYWLAHDRGASPEPGRIYWLAIAVSFALSLATLLGLGAWRRERTWFWPILAILLSSQAFVTFTSSGLETPLLYLLLTLFFTRFLDWREAAPRRDYALAFGLASLALLTRLDASLLFLPGCGWLLARGVRDHGAGIALPLALGFAPFALWELFSIVYFGFPFPNTYYAKLGLNVDRGVLLQMGLGYLRTSLLQDPITLGVILAGAAAGWLGDTRARLAAISGLLYVLYIVWIGGDFIGARFLAPAFLLSALLLLGALHSRLPRADRRWVGLGVALALLYGAIVPGSPLRAFRDAPRAQDVAFYYPASGLARWRPGDSFPFARFLYVESRQQCAALRTNDFVVAVWGDGLNGFCRGPMTHLIDVYGVTDPLMARLSIRIPGPFKPGHVPKPIPAGYVESILEQRNRIRDPELAPYYGALRTIVSGPLFTSERWRAILALNLTGKRRFRDPYLALASPPAWMRREAGRRPGAAPAR